MMFRTLGAAAMLMLTTSLAQAAFDANDVAAQLTSDGYTRIEIKIGQSVAKVEAIKGTTKIEVTYDIATGDVLKTETQAVDADDDTTPGVEIDDRGVRGDDDGPDHDVNDDHGGGDDDGPDHDVGDDHGGDSGHHGGDDDGDDDGDHSGHGGGDDDDGDHSGHGGGDDD